MSRYALLAGLFGILFAALVEVHFSVKGISPDGNIVKEGLKK